MKQSDKFKTKKEIYKKTLKNYDKFMDEEHKHRCGICYVINQNGLNIYVDSPSKELPEELQLFVCNESAYWLDLEYELEDHEVRKTILMFCVAMSK